MAALWSFALAKAPGMPHRGGAATHWFGAAPSVRPLAASHGTRDLRAPGAGSSHRVPADRADHVDHVARDASADGFGVYRPDVRRLGGGSDYLSDARGRMQSAGAITQVSAESRSVPRQPPNGAVRSGSIRADVARYNEERGSTRAMQRSNDYQRPPESSPYRN